MKMFGWVSMNVESWSSWQMNNREWGSIAGVSGQHVPESFPVDSFAKEYSDNKTIKREARGCSGPLNPPMLGNFEVCSPQTLGNLSVPTWDSVITSEKRGAWITFDFLYKTPLLGFSLTLVLSILSLGVMANTAMALPWVERLEGGSAAIQNSGDTSYRPASVGAQIGLDEAVLPSPRARMVVRCPNNTRSRVVPGRISGIGLICPNLGIARRSRGENEVLALNNGTFPYVL